MQTFLAGQALSFEFDLSSTGLTPTGVEFAVLDHEGVVLAARAPLPGYVAPATDIVVTIAQGLNALDAAMNAAARTINIYVIGTGGAAGTALLSSSYRLVHEDRLPVPTASFQTLAGAEMEAADMLNVDAWNTATDQQKVSALIDARNRISLLRFSYIPEDWQSRVSRTIDIVDLDELTLSEFTALDAAFKQALRRAQVIQAAESIAQSSSQDQSYRDAGVTSITIGESSRTYSPNRSMEHSRTVCGRARGVLSKYLAPARIARA
jgi:hypothetical protein